MRHEGRMRHVEDHRVERRPSCACDGGGRPELPKRGESTAKPTRWEGKGVNEGVDRDGEGEESTEGSIVAEEELTKASTEGKGGVRVAESTETKRGKE